ncbi:MAG: hypothetical protein K2M55_04955 [Muribaculaceae bacterium]|nr:hypothetical protein [Muribaculaceae bacterium]
MKKLFASFLAVALGLTAFAAVPGKSYIKNAPLGFTTETIEGATTPASSLSRASISMNYSPAAEPYQAMGFQNAAVGAEYAQAFEFTGDVATQFAGNEITAFTFWTGTNNTSGQNQIKNYTIFLTYDLEEEPFYTQAYTVTQSGKFTFNTVNLDKPVKIEAGKPLYMGMRYALTSPNDLSIVVDYVNHGNDYSGCWIGMVSGGKLMWDNLADQVGFLCLGCVITGDQLPNNKVAVAGLSAQPVVEAGKPFAFEVALLNRGAENVKTLGIKLSVGDNEPQEETFTFNGTGVPYNQYAQLNGELQYDVASANPVPVTFEITKVNGAANTETEYASASTSIICITPGTGYEKQVVIEEMTGTWCGYCPAGIVTMEAIREDFPNGGLIPVCVHVDDEMTATSWVNVAAMANGVPSAYLNRQMEVYPGDYSEVLAGYEALKAIPALGKVELTAEPAEGATNKIHVKATTSFLFDMADASDRYRLSFALTRDNVGPYKQTNYYAGQNVSVGGWEKKPSSVETTYNDVALTLTTFAGIAGSIPASVTGGTEYTYERDLQISSTVSINDVHAIVYLLDTKTGVIENAAVVKTIAGVDEVLSDSDLNAPVEYFNLQGVKVQNPENGLYIRRQGKTVTKVYLN